MTKEVPSEVWIYTPEYKWDDTKSLEGRIYSDPFACIDEINSMLLATLPKRGRGDFEEDIDEDDFAFQERKARLGILPKGGLVGAEIQEEDFDENFKLYKFARLDVFATRMQSIEVGSPTSDPIEYAESFRTGKLEKVPYTLDVAPKIINRKAKVIKPKIVLDENKLVWVYHSLDSSTTYLDRAEYPFKDPVQCTREINKKRPSNLISQLRPLPSGWEFRRGSLCATNLHNLIIDNAKDKNFMCWDEGRKVLVKGCYQLVVYYENLDEYVIGDSNIGPPGYISEPKEAFQLGELKLILKN